MRLGYDILVCAKVRSSVIAKINHADDTIKKIRDISKKGFCPGIFFLGIENFRV
jgi:hypothetical protein